MPAPRRTVLLLAVTAALATLPSAGTFASAAPPRGKQPAVPRPSAAAQAVNAFRTENGLSPVVDDAGLMKAAQRQADAMAAAGVMSHSVAGDFSSRMSQAGIRAGAAAENVAMGQSSLAEVMQDWKASSGHRRNLLMPQATRVAVAQRRGADGRLYWAMVLAAPEPAPHVAGQPAGFVWGGPFPLFAQ